MPRDTDVLMAEDGRFSLDAQCGNAISDPSSPARKRGRPRKAQPSLISNMRVPTGGLSSETSEGSPAGGGLGGVDIQECLATASSTQTGSDAVAEDAGQHRLDAHFCAARTFAPIARTPSKKTAGGGHKGRDTHLMVASPSSNTVVPDTDDGGGEARAREALMPTWSLPGLTLTVNAIIMDQKKRTFLIQSRNRQTNATLAYIRSYLGWNLDAPEKERKKIEARARSIVDKVEKGKPLPEEDRDIGNACSALILASKAARRPLDDMLKGYIAPPATDGEKPRKVPGVEDQMADLVRKTPVWSWAEGVRGLGASGLAIIIAEAGDLSNYANPGKLWKRMGLAPYAKGEHNRAASTWRSCGGLTTEDWQALGYKPHRRSEMWNRAEPLLKAQIRQVKDADGNDTGDREVLGIYGKVYLDRKRYELERNPEMSKMLAHNRASRYMEKRLLKHVWQVWNGHPMTD